MRLPKIALKGQRSEQRKSRTPQGVLEEGLSRYFGRPVHIAALERQALEEQSTYPIERLRVTLVSGEELSVIFKRLRGQPRFKGSRREVLIYRSLLAGQRFGAPALYASAYDEARGHYWLFLEDVGDETLHGDHDNWLAAVRWLAEMHGVYWGQDEELRSLGYLAEQGPDYYQMLADAARRHLRLAGARRARVRFDSLMARYDAVVAYLVHQPRTLVHGDVLPHNLLLQPGPRIRPIDWEDAAIGLAAWDVARLLDGWGTDKPIFLAAYLSELARHAAVPLDQQAFHRALDHCAILNVLCHLGWDLKACRDASFVDGLLDELETAWDHLDRERIDA